MGLFILNLENTLEDDIECAIMNLELYLKERERGGNYSYLLDFSISQINDAKNKLNDST